MLTTKEVHNVKVCKQPKPGKEYTKDGLPRRKRKLGKVFKTVFSPDGYRVVGFIVRQPDLLWMIKRPEKFLALDAVEIDEEGAISATKGFDSWDERAIKRLGVDWDTCILWEGIEVRDTAGETIGHVDDISFDEHTGEVKSFFLDDGGTARALIGSIEIPADLIIGYEKGYLIVEDEAGYLSPTGGLAAKAGAASGKLKVKTKEGVEKTDEAISKAYDKGAQGVGKVITRTKNMVSDTRDEFRRARGKGEKSEEAPEPKKTSSAAKAKGTSGGAAPKKATGASQTKKATGTSETKKKSASDAVSDHMKGVGSMFSGFKSEFDKARKGK